MITQQATLGFVQVWLDVVAIISGSLLGCGSGERNIAEHWFLLFIFINKPSGGYGRTEF